MKRLAGIVLTCLGVLAGTAAVVWAAPATITGDGADTFVGGPNFPHDAGTVGQLIVTGSTHNVTANAKGPDGKPLFRSNTISGGSTPVNGTQYLAAGSYPFVCTVHPTTMTGNLVVGAGTPQARPSAVIKILSKKVKQVLKSGKLKVSVATAAPSVELTLKFGAAVPTIGQATSGSGVSVVKLNKAGKRLLRNSPSTKLRLIAAIDFASPVTALKKLK